MTAEINKAVADPMSRDAGPTLERVAMVKAYRTKFPGASLKAAIDAVDDGWRPGVGSFSELLAEIERLETSVATLTRERDEARAANALNMRQRKEEAEALATLRDRGFTLSPAQHAKADSARQSKEGGE